MAASGAVEKAGREEYWQEQVGARVFYKSPRPRDRTKARMAPSCFKKNNYLISLIVVILVIFYFMRFMNAHSKFYLVLTLS